MYIRDEGTGRPPPQLCFKLGQRGGGSLGQRLDPAVREIPDPAGDADPDCPAHGEVPEPYPLHLALDQVPPSHDPLAVRCRSIPKSIGVTETAMIARITKLKLFRTAGKLPK